MIELYPYQESGVEFLTARGRAFLADQMGMGKSVQALVSARRLGAQTLVICGPKFSLSVWEMEIAKWFPELSEGIAIVAGSQKEREAGWRVWGGLDGKRVLLTTYYHLEEVSAAVGTFDLLILDECHLVSNRRTKAFKAACKLKSRWLIMMSGTPTRKSPDELWTALRLIDPKRHPSYWRFVSDFFMVDDGKYGKEVLGLKHPAAFRSHLAPYLLRRVKSEVLTELPPLTRQRVFLPLEPETQVAYDRLCDELMLEWGDSLLTVPNPLTLLTRLRQLTVCPQVLGLDLRSEPMEATKRMVTALLSEGRKAVVFCPFREALPFLATGFPPAVTFFVHGKQDRIQNSEQIRQFQEWDGPAVMLATTGMGASWSANTADSCFFLGFSWSPIENQQCEGRLHRHGQRSAVNAYYMGGKGTVDEVIADVIEGKVRLADLALKSALKGGCIPRARSVECLTI